MAEQVNPGAEGIKLFGFEIRRASKKEDEKNQELKEIAMARLNQLYQANTDLKVNEMSCFE